LGCGPNWRGRKNSAFNSFRLFYYNQILSVSATLTSIALAIAIIFDAISDPVIGSISDQLRLLPVGVLLGLPIGVVIAAYLTRVLDKK